MKVISYEDRVAKMKVPGDEDKQMRLAKAYVKTLHNKAKKATSLKEKLILGEAVKDAEKTLRSLRLNVFDLEDMLLEKASKAPAAEAGPATNIPTKGM